MKDDLENLRKEIREVDRQILKLAAKRFWLAERIGENKKKQGLPIVNLKVEKEVVSRAVKLGKEFGLNDVFSSKLINLLIQESVRTQAGNPKNRAIYLYEILEKVKELEAKGENIIKLEIGEPDLSSPPEVKKAALNSLFEKKHIGYGSSLGLPELREAIAKDLSQKYSVDISEKQVLITPGGKFAVFAAIFSKISTGDRVVIPEPFWPVYDNCSRRAGGRVDFVHTCLEDDWRINMERLEEALDVKPKLLILCSPSNPTGKIIPEDDFREICRLADENGTCVLSDEVYSAYAFKPSTSILEIADSNYIHVNSFSKKYGMTGWRIGYAVSDVETIARMQRLVQISVTCVPEFIQRAALKALTMKQEKYDSFVQEMEERIKLVCKELDRYPLSYARPEGGMYLFPRADIEGFDSREFAQQLLSEKKVGVAPGEAFGEYPEHFRISLGINRWEIKEGITRIGELVEEWQGR